MMIHSNTLGVKEKIEEFMEVHKDYLSECGVYIDVTSGKEVDRRIAQHENVHGPVYSAKITEVSSVFLGFLFEAICMRQKSSSFKELLNTSPGHEEQALQSVVAGVMSIYMFLAPNPWCKRNNKDRNGFMNYAASRADPLKNKAFCFHCMKNLEDDSSISSHSEQHDKKQFRCEFCMFESPSENSLQRHVERNHTSQFVCWGSGCSFSGPLSAFIDGEYGHFKVFIS